MVWSLQYGNKDDLAFPMKIQMASSIVLIFSDIMNIQIFCTSHLHSYLISMKLSFIF